MPCVKRFSRENKTGSQFIQFAAVKPRDKTVKLEFLFIQKGSRD